MSKNCLSEQDLILLYYSEVPQRTTVAAASAHLADCPACQSRRAQLAADLARIPAIGEPDPAVATRVAARVNERLKHGHRWLPTAGLAFASAMALVALFVYWLPSDQLPTPSPQPLASYQVQGHSPQPATIDPDLIDQLDLLEELDTLQAIEGV